MLTMTGAQVPPKHNILASTLTGWMEAHQFSIPFIFLASAFQSFNIFWKANATNDGGVKWRV